MTKKKVKIILHKTINSSMRKGDIIKISHGYARNYLLPNKIVSLATKNMIKQLHKHKKIQIRKILEQHNQLNNLKNYLEKIQKFSIYKRINKHYKFFGSITPKDISQLIKNSTGNTIDKKQIIISQIRQVGFYLIQIKLLQNKIVNLQIQILPLFTEVNLYDL